MRRNSVFLGVLMILCAAGASAQSFSFYSTLRAGLPGGGDWEVGTGSTPAQTAATWNTQDFRYDSSLSDNHWRGAGLSQDFEIGYNALTNSAYTKVKDFNGLWTTATIVNPGAPFPANTVWTLPASSFSVSVQGKVDPSSIVVQGLTLSPNVALVSGSLPASLGVLGALGVDATASLSAPLVINAAANGGSWFVAGNISFTGLVGAGGSARRSELQFNLQANGNQTPEAATMSLMGGGLVTLGLLGRRRRARAKK